MHLLELQLSHLHSGRADAPAAEGQAGSSFSTPTPPPWGEVRVGGSPREAAETGCPPPPGWAISNQLLGQGALWTEPDKRPCVHCGLLIYRPLHPLYRAHSRVPSAGRGQLPEPHRRSPPGGWERSVGSHRVPAHLEPLLASSPYRVSAHLGPPWPRPSSCQARPPSPEETADSVGTLLRLGPQNWECARESRAAAGSPAPRPPRAPPLLDQLYPDSGVAAGGTESHPPEDQSLNQRARSHRLDQLNPRAPP